MLWLAAERNIRWVARADVQADDFVPFASFSSVASAQVAKGLLEAEGVDCLLDPSDPLAVALMSGSQGIRLLVVSHLQHRARLVLSEAEFSESKLQFLATGDLPESE